MLKTPLNRPIKIVLIDDARDIHALVDIAFTEYPSVKIEHCELPEKAETFCTKIIPDLILLDLQMPKLSGEEVLKKIRANPKISQIPIVFLTGTDEAKEVQRLSSLGTIVIKKPFSVKTLAKQVLALI